MKAIEETLGEEDWFKHTVEDNKRMPSNVKKIFKRLAYRLDDILENRRLYNRTIPND